MSTGAPAADAEGREPGSEEREPGSEEPTGFVGRGGWHLVAFLAALALVLVMSIDWYTTEQGEEFRRVEDNARSGQQVDPDIDERAAQAAENQEKTAWQADALIDRLIVLACLIAFLGAVVAAFMRSAGRRPEPPWHPSAIATVAGVVATLLILYRMIQPPGINDAAVIEIGAPLGLIAVGILTIGSRLAVLGERGELAGGEAAEVAAGPPPEDEGAPEPEADGESFLARFRRRRERGPEAAVADAPPAEAEPTEASAFEFDFPAPAPDAEEREEEEAELLEEAEEHAPPVDERPVGAESPEEAPEWAAPDPVSAEEAPVEAEDVPEEPAEGVPDLILEDPVEAEPVGGETVEEEPVEAAAADADRLDEEPPEAAAADAEPLDEGLEDEPVADEPVEEEPLDDEPIEEEPVEDGADEPADEVGPLQEEAEESPVEDPEDEPPPVEEPPVEEPPVEEPPVEEPPVEEPEEPLALGEEIEFEYEEDAPRPEEGDEPDEQRPS